MPIKLLSGGAGDLLRTKGRFCVVGAGMAGLFVARKLALAGHRVVVLESGRLGFDPHIHELNTIIDVNGRYTRALTGRYRGLGGSSSQWGGRMIPIYRHDAEARGYLGLEAWPFAFDELESYGREIESVFGLPHGTFGAEAVGDASFRESLAKNDTDFQSRWAKWINYRRCNLATLWKSELERLPEIEVWLGATVVDFTLDADAGRLSSVKARGHGGERLEVSADQFVIAAGTIETTRLLLWLNARSNGHAFERCTALGHYFQDHLKAGVATIARKDQALSNRLFGYHFVDGTRRSLHIDLTPQAQETDGVSSAFVYAAMDLSHSRLERIKKIARGLQRRQTRLRDIVGLAADAGLVARSVYWRYLRRQVYMPRDVGLEVQVAIEQAPDWDNHIVLSSERDRLDLPKVELNWRPSAKDERTFQATIARLKRFWTRSGIEQDCPLDWRTGQPDYDRPVTDIAEAYAHPSGTTRMGLDPATSVVGPDLACHAIPNVSVASASVFPTSGSANPTFTILKLALRLADRLLAMPVATQSAPLHEFS